MGVLRSKKQEGFAQHFVLHGDATKAYRANYNAKKMAPKTVHVQACKLKKNPKVAIRIQELEKIANQVAEKEFGLDAKWLLSRLAGIDIMDVLDILNDDMSVKDVSVWPLVWRQTISVIDVSTTDYEDNSTSWLKKIKWPDKVKNLEMIGRHIDIQAFKDKTESDHVIKDYSIDPTISTKEAADKYKALIAGGN